VLDAENVGHQAAGSKQAIYEQLHECELRLRVNFRLANAHLAPAFFWVLVAQFGLFLVFVTNALRIFPSSNVGAIHMVLACAALLFLVHSCAMLARPAERWLEMLLALQQRLQTSDPIPPGDSAPGLGPVPDVMSHLYRNPAGLLMYGVFVTQGLVLRVATAALLPLLLLFFTAAPRDGDVFLAS
jgi:hypothetical protein